MSFGLSGGVSTLLSLRRARDERRQADSASERAEQAALEQQALARRRADLAEEQWARYQRLYDPLEEASATQALRALGYMSDLHEAQARDMMADIGLYAPLKRARVEDELRSMTTYAPLRDQLVERALAGERPDYAAAEGRAAADARSALDRARSETRRRTLGFGLAPERLSTARQGGVGDLEQASLEVAARSRARQAEAERASEEGRRNVSLALQARGAALDLPRSALSEPDYHLASNPSAALGLFSGAQSGLTRAASGLAGLAGSEERGAAQAMQHGLRALESFGF